MSRDLPDVEDSIVWGRKKTDSERAHLKLEDALTIVLTAGKTLRACRECGSPATEFTLLAYELREGIAHAHVREHCHDCGAESTWFPSGIYWACMEAMRAWEGMRTATSLFRSESRLQQDLDELDVPPDQPG